ncbi:hypothetical protein MAA_11780 [Metarhizium robertsii ARSEF 23]|uniref:Uncharacterized protein n=1 Tax=Metarhizium robertsii (strain ARSEF 23 / ATCC MYA-3075) TaxID=655844 RepID=A0A0B2X6V6_METRA|nr:uncharacterized protein MAA_11780 [Metarhizium robertsii ARSEF 23]KHO10618.1 hypothetical protein MAA_11780 [Metarhizium robertsii ARSEF 23]
MDNVPVISCVFLPFRQEGSALFLSDVYRHALPACDVQDQTVSMAAALVLYALPRMYGPDCRKGVFIGPDCDQEAASDAKASTVSASAASAATVVTKAYASAS